MGKSHGFPMEFHGDVPPLRSTSWTSPVPSARPLPSWPRRPPSSATATTHRRYGLDPSVVFLLGG